MAACILDPELSPNLCLLLNRRVRLGTSHREGDNSECVRTSRGIGIVEQMRWDFK
jgi:hypothetical protein